MMDRATQKRLFAEIRGYFENSGTKLSAKETYHRATTYTDPAHYEDERELMRRYARGDVTTNTVDSSFAIRYS